MSDHLIERWLSGEASTDEVDALRARLERDPALLDRLYRAAERECELHQLFAAESVSANAAPRVATARFARPRTNPPPRREHWRALLMPLAACLALALLIPLAVSRYHRPAGVARLGADADPSAPAGHGDAPLVAGAGQPHASGPVVRSAPAVAPARKDEDASPLDEHVASARAPATDTLALAERPLAGLRPEPEQPEHADQTPAPTPAPTPRLAINLEPRQRAPTSSAIERIDGELKDVENTALPIRYTLRVPRQTPEHAHLGLVLVFHGAGGNEQHLPDSMETTLRARGAAGDYLVASLKSKGERWTTDDEPRVLAFLDWVRRSYPVDVRRIVITGVSNGGWMVDWFGSRHQDILAGIIAFCSYGADPRKVANAAETQTSYYLVHGTEDRDVNVKGSRIGRDNLHALGYRYVYREMPGEGHVDVWNDERVRADMVSWLDTLRHKQLPLGEDERKVIAQFANRDEAERLLLSEGGADELLRVGGIAAERVLLRHLHAKNPAVRAAAVSALTRCDLDPAAAALVAPLLDDKETPVRHAALATLIAAGSWNDQEALAAVCRFAGTHARDRAERLAVLKALSQSLAFAVSANGDNALLYETFIYLLDDDDLPLREAAAAALATSPAAGKVPDQFGYRADAAPATRREASARWKKWYTEQFPASPP